MASSSPITKRPRSEDAQDQEEEEQSPRKQVKFDGGIVCVFHTNVYVFTGSVEVVQDEAAATKMVDDEGEDAAEENSL